MAFLQCITVYGQHLQILTSSDTLYSNISSACERKFSDCSYSSKKVPLGSCLLSQCIVFAKELQPSSPINSVELHNCMDRPCLWAKPSEMFTPPQWKRSRSVKPEGRGRVKLTRPRTTFISDYTAPLSGVYMSPPQHTDQANSAFDDHCSSLTDSPCSTSHLYPPSPSPLKQHLRLSSEV